jgi:SNF2 family DNA or RNA helicase
MERGNHPDRAAVSERLYRAVRLQLNAFQRGVLDECLALDRCGLSLPMGSGKTVLALALSLRKARGRPILVVAAKSLIASWLTEVRKFFGDELKTVVVHNSVMAKTGGVDAWRFAEDTHLVLTTPEVLSAAYRDTAVREQFVRQVFDQNSPTLFTNVYQPATQPFLAHTRGGGLFYSVEWGAYVIDEAQMFTNAETRRCQGLAAVYAQTRWLLSGTLFDEPRAERILGYHILLQPPGVPMTLPATRELIWSRRFRGLAQHIVSRAENAAFTPPTLRQHIVEHNLAPAEERVYTMMRHVLKQVQERARRARWTQDVEEHRRFTSYKMVMIMYLRQALVCPLLPLASVSLEAASLKKKDELAALIVEQVRALELGTYLDDECSARSSRIDRVISSLEERAGERVVLFSCFSSALDLMQHYLGEETDRPVLRMTSGMSMARRGELVEEFRQTEGAVLLLTYQLGANGLNLQFAATVMLMDFWWNAARTQQAIARVFRFGQRAPEVHVYLFTANTAIENIIFRKQRAKQAALTELMTGAQTTAIPKINMREVIRMLTADLNRAEMDGIRYY